VPLKLKEYDAVYFGGRSETRADVVLRDNYASVQMVGGRKRLNHRGRHGTSIISVSLLEFGHRPRKLAHWDHLNLTRKRRESGSEPVDGFRSQSRHWRRKLAGDSWIGQWWTQAKEPQACRGDAIGCHAVEILRPFARENVAKDVIVDDDGSHLCGCEVRIVQSSNESQMVFGGECLSQEVLPSTWRKKDHGVT
jgi:hypothetical protein